MADIGKTLRISNSAGPCLVNVAGGGKIIQETRHFWLTETNGGPKRVSKKNSNAHTEPCRCCRDHAQTMYPQGYMD